MNYLRLTHVSVCQSECSFDYFCGTLSEHLESCGTVNLKDYLRGHVTYTNGRPLLLLGEKKKKKKEASKYMTRLI